MDTATQRRTAAILAADIAGYSRLIAEAEEDTLHRLSDQRALFEDAIPRFNGRIFNTAGDAVRAEFPNGGDAFECAVDLQESLRARNASYPLSKQMNVRIGIAVGEVIDQGGDVHGDCATLASSLEAVAPPGGICISGDIHAIVAERSREAFTDMGELRLKSHPDRRIRAYAVIIGQPPQPGPLDESKATKPAAPSSARRSFVSPYVVVPAAVVILALGVGAGLALLQKAVDQPTPTEPIKTASATPEKTAVPTPDKLPDLTVKSEPPVVKLPRPVPMQPSPATNPPPTPPTPAATSQPTPTPSTGTAIPPQPDRTKVATATPNEPDWSAINAQLQRLWRECGDTDTDRAISGCRSLLREKTLAPNDQALANLYLGKALQKSSLGDAIDAYGEAIRLNPSAESYNTRGMAFTEKNEWEKAIADYSEAIRLNRNFGEAYNNRAWTKFRANRTSEAADDAKEAVRLLSNAAYAWDTSGHINEKLGKKEAAIADFRKAIALDNKSEDSRAGLKRLGATP
jgi:class 3 adenylate cyclase/Flp pilus assembly protein TadD